LTRQGVAKLMLKNYHKTLKDLETTDVINHWMKHAFCKYEERLN
jgi:hypothetical protein